MGVVIWIIISWFSIDPAYLTIIGSLKALVISLLLGAIAFGVTAYLLRIEGRNYVLEKISNRLGRLNSGFR